MSSMRWWVATAVLCLHGVAPGQGPVGSGKLEAERSSAAAESKPIDFHRRRTNEFDESVGRQNPGVRVRLDRDLAWLVSLQDHDGGWPGPEPLEGVEEHRRFHATSYATLALLGRGYELIESPWAPTIRRGLQWLQSRETDTGSFVVGQKVVSRELQALATCALVEASCLSLDRELERDARLAVRRLAGVADRTDPWAALALFQAKLGGLLEDWSRRTFANGAGAGDQGGGRSVLLTIIRAESRPNGLPSQHLREMQEELRGRDPVRRMFSVYAAYQYGRDPWREALRLVEKAATHGWPEELVKEGKSTVDVVDMSVGIITMQVWNRYDRKYAAPRGGYKNR